MKKQPKFKYWHLITNVSDEAKERGIKIGEVVTHRYAFDGRPTFFNMTKGKEFWLYDIVFIAKIRAEVTGKELCDILNEKIKKKGLGVTIA